MAKDNVSPQQEAGTMTVIDGEMIMLSECCLSPVENVITPHPENPNWQGSHFVCKDCSKETRVHTDSRIIALKQEIAALKKQINGDNI